MNRHLDDHEMASAAAGLTLEPEKLAHLEGCVSCRGSVTQFLDQVNKRRRAMEEETPDWDAQLKRILDALPPAPVTSIAVRRRWLRPLLAAAATLTIAIGTGLFIHQNGSAPASSPRPEIGVEEILAQADSLLAEDSIPGLDVFDDITDDDLAALFGAQNS